jgi:hypothetical protein
MVPRVFVGAPFETSSFGFSATDMLGAALGLFPETSDVSVELESLDAVVLGEPESPQPMKQSGIASKQLPRSLRWVCFVFEGMAVMFEGSEDHLNELGLSWSHLEKGTFKDTRIKQTPDFIIYAPKGTASHFASGCYV